MSNSEPTQRIVITGSSSGFGLLTAKSLLTLGYEVVATMRDSTTRNASKAAELRTFSADTAPHALRERADRRQRRLRDAAGRFTNIGQPANWIAADIVRIVDGRLAAHWDVIQDQATREESKSGLLMFKAGFLPVHPVSRTGTPRRAAVPPPTRGVTLHDNWNRR